MTKFKTEDEKNSEYQKLREILILLEQLFQREEAAAKAIIGCLYDIATINLINKYLPLWGINSTVKYLTRFPRPIAKSLGVKLYLQPKCPQLITDWLYTLVDFSEKQIPTLDTKVMTNELLPMLNNSKLEIKSLQKKVKILAGSLVITIAMFSGSFMWISHNLETNPLKLLSVSQENFKN